MQGWGIVRVVHVLGDRRDHFESIRTWWEIFRIVSEERKRREIDPTLRVIGECVDELKKDRKATPIPAERLERHAGILTVMTGCSMEVLRMPAGTLKGVAKLRREVITLLRNGAKKAAG